MKIFITLNFVCLLTQGTIARSAVKAVPLFPNDCEDQISNNGLYCSEYDISGGRFTITFAAVVNKESFPRAESILARYASFTRWPEYVATSPESVMEFSWGGSVALDSLTGPDAVITMRHVFDYSLKVQGIPFLKQFVRGISYNTIVAPYIGALASLEFAVQTDPVPGFPEKPKGLKSQTGSLHALACDPSILSFCDDKKWLLIYQKTVQPDVPFALTIAAKTSMAGVEDLFVGMLDESIRD